MTATLGLETLAGRCPQCAFHIALQGCRCEGSEYELFKAAVARAVRPDGTVSNNDLRPHIQAIPHKHRGLMYRKAKGAGLLTLIPGRTEPSRDEHGKNTDKEAKFYAVRAGAR